MTAEYVMLATFAIGVAGAAVTMAVQRGVWRAAPTRS